MLVSLIGITRCTFRGLVSGFRIRIAEENFIVTGLRFSPHDSVLGRRNSNVEESGALIRTRNLCRDRLRLSEAGREENTCG